MHLGQTVSSRTLALPLVSARSHGPSLRRTPLPKSTAQVECAHVSPAAPGHKVLTFMDGSADARRSSHCRQRPGISAVFHDQDPLASGRPRAADVDALLPWPVIESLVANGLIPADRFRVVVNGNDVPSTIYADPRGRLQCDTIQADGARRSSPVIGPRPIRHRAALCAQAEQPAEPVSARLPPCIHRLRRLRRPGHFGAPSTSPASH